MLQPRGDRKRREEQREHENIVDTERLLEQVAGKVLLGNDRAIDCPKQGAEADADSNPCGTGYQGAAKGGLFISSATEEIGYQQQNDESSHFESTPQRRAHQRSVDLGLRPADSRTGRSSSANVRRAMRRAR